MGLGLQALEEWPGTGDPSFFSWTFVASCVRIGEWCLSQRGHSTQDITARKGSGKRPSFLILQMKPPLMSKGRLEGHQDLRYPCFYDLTHCSFSTSKGHNVELHHLFPEIIFRKTWRKKWKSLIILILQDDHGNLWLKSFQSFRVYRHFFKFGLYHLYCFLIFLKMVSWQFSYALKYSTRTFLF